MWGRNPARFTMLFLVFNNLQTGQTISKYPRGPYLPVIPHSPRRSGRLHWMQYLSWSISPLGTKVGLDPSRGNRSLSSHLITLAVPSPPLSPLVYLTLRPWTLPEYLLLLSVIPLCSKEEDADWEEIAGKLNAATSHQPRSAWDCWHRWAVPWSHPQAEPRANTYPHAPGVQHEYNFLDLEGLIDLWTTLTSALGGHGSPSPLVSQGPTIAMAQTRHPMGYTYHPGAHPARFNLARVFSRSMQRIRHPLHPQMCLRAAWVMSVTAG